MTGSLSDLMEFDHVVEVHEDGSVTDSTVSPYFELVDDELSAPDGWSLLDGFSGQYGYSGPIMHPSEYIGGGLERYIRATPGLYVALAAYPLEEDENGEREPYGWAIATTYAHDETKAGE